MLAIIDSGIANVRSVANAFAAIDCETVITADRGVLCRADRLVLPGVGAFADGMKNLRERGLLDALEEKVRQGGTPLLGICLGMQLLTETGSEHGEHPGLGWIAGRTIAFDFAGPELRVPHVGWNNVTIERREPRFAGLPEDPDFYFVHSFHVAPTHAGSIAATCDYGGRFVAAIVQGNVAGVQFHPEKSHKVGLALLKNFARWEP
jgi:glutamine amidotransferase